LKTHFFKTERISFSLNSASPETSTFESAEWQHGAFTLALLEGMNGGKQHPTTQKPSVVSEFPLIQTSKQQN